MIFESKLMEISFNLNLISSKPSQVLVLTSPESVIGSLVLTNDKVWY